VTVDWNIWPLRMAAISAVAPNSHADGSTYDSAAVQMSHIPKYRLARLP